MPKAPRSKKSTTAPPIGNILLDTAKKVRKTRKKVEGTPTTRERQNINSVERQKVGLDYTRPQIEVSKHAVGDLFMEEQQLQAVPFGFGFKGLILGEGIHDGTHRK